MNIKRNIDDMMNLFRIASRELFNNFFRVNDPYNNDGWVFERRFFEVQDMLFKKLVVEPANLSELDYGDIRRDILVELRDCEVAPIMINREMNSGYWDYPLREVSGGTKLLFISFFDWDQLGFRDNRYVRAQIDDWPSHPEVIGKHVLIETHHVRFVKA